jgi:capsular polysaccharide export protein
MSTSGFSWRKRQILNRFVTERSLGGLQMPDQAADFFWGPSQLHPPQSSRPRVYVEDGFLRSVGLGADLVWPCSWLFDRHGVHFECDVASDLEQQLCTRVLSATDTERASKLISAIVERGLSKYNEATPDWKSQSSGLPKVLVVGQVETDAAVRFGSPAIKTNLQLLQTVRRMRPDAWLVYKPHPDVLAGLRHEGSGEADAKQWCDEVLGPTNPDSVLAQVDEVHVMTSLMGFEALLRGKPVVCHGIPFYAGYGLTQDQIPTPRRIRTRSLEELASIALVNYPAYIHPVTRKRCEPEDVVDCLAQLKRRKKNNPLLTLSQRLMRPLLRRP